VLHALQTLTRAALLVIAVAGAAQAQPPEARLAALHAGVAITNWFRFPPRADAGSLRAYLSDAALAELRAVGFTHLRLPVQPEMLWQDGAIDPARLESVVIAVQRIQSARLAVVLALAPATWRLESSAPDRLRLLATWRALARALAYVDHDRLLPEVLNEPVFAGDEHGWEALQADALGAIRVALPDATVILTGADWGGVDGLRALSPVADRNVVYSVHFYEPAELTALAAYRSDLDRAALSRLPFPTDPERCRDGLGGMSGATRDVGAFYCATGWDAAHIGARFDQVAVWARSCGGSGRSCAILLGEFGATRHLPTSTRIAWIAAARKAAETHGFGWTLWGYDDVMGFDVARPPPLRPRLDPDLLRALGLRAGSSDRTAR
jgi:endoglucanase